VGSGIQSEARPMDDISVPSFAALSARQAQRPPRDGAAWAAACVLTALTLAALVPPAIFVWVLVSHSGTDWQANHASHVAAAKVATLMILLPCGGAVLAGLATLVPRIPPSAASRVATMAAGAFTASLLLTVAVVGGFLWVVSHAQLTF
jgi:nitrate reductase gamma subunit